MDSKVQYLFHFNGNLQWVRPRKDTLSQTPPTNQPQFSPGAPRNTLWGAIISLHGPTLKDQEHKHNHLTVNLPLINLSSFYSKVISHISF